MCKIMDFPQNCEMETVATCFTTDGNGSYHGLAPSIFKESIIIIIIITCIYYALSSSVMFSHTRMNLKREAVYD